MSQELSAQNGIEYPNNLATSNSTYIGNSFNTPYSTPVTGSGQPRIPNIVPKSQFEPQKTSCYSRCYSFITYLFYCNCCTCDLSKIICCSSMPRQRITVAEQYLEQTLEKNQKQDPKNESKQTDDGKSDYSSDEISKHKDNIKLSELFIITTPNTTTRSMETHQSLQESVLCKMSDSPYMEKIVDKPTFKYDENQIQTEKKYSEKFKSIKKLTIEKYDAFKHTFLDNSCVPVSLEISRQVENFERNILYSWKNQPDETLKYIFSFITALEMQKDFLKNFFPLMLIKVGVDISWEAVLPVSDKLKLSEANNLWFGSDTMEICISLLFRLLLDFTSNIAKKELLVELFNGLEKYAGVDHFNLNKEQLQLAKYQLSFIILSVLKAYSFIYYMKANSLVESGLEIPKDINLLILQFARKPFSELDLRDKVTETVMELVREVFIAFNLKAQLNDTMEDSLLPKDPKLPRDPKSCLKSYLSIL